LENKDALERYTAATYGYNNTLPTAISANAQYRQTGFTGFEDVLMNNCKIEHFGFDFETYKNNFTQEHSHTGRYGVKVPRNDNVKMRKIIQPCQNYSSSNQ
jgi:hypothetical protein